MRHPTCYVRFDDEGQTLVWTLCPGCAAEIVIHPRPGPNGVPVPWYEIACPICGKKAKEFGYGAES